MDSGRRIGAPGSVGSVGSDSSPASSRSPPRSSSSARARRRRRAFSPDSVTTTGTAHSPNQAAATSMETRTLRPFSCVTPNQPTSGLMKPTKRMSSRTMPPR